MDLSLFSDAVHAAAKRIKPHVRLTPVDSSDFLSQATQANVFIKLESEQVTGSFKVRGACNKLLKSLEENEEETRSKGVALASTGNHALACIYIMNKVGLSGRVYVPSTITSTKESMLRGKGAVIVKCGADCLDGELNARKAAQDEGMVLICPYNDEDIMAGQGTIGLEILQQLPDVDVVYVSVGGGGLIAGIAAFIKHNKPNVKIVGCQPQASKVMYESVKAGKIVVEESLPTLSEGTAGGIEDEAMTLPVCTSCVDEWVLVTEEEIAYALYLTLRDQHKLVEGSAALAMASVIKHGHKYAGKTIAVVSCGANISMDSVKMVLDKYHESK